MKNTNAEAMIILLDDTFEKLDEAHKKGKISNTQTYVMCLQLAKWKNRAKNAIYDWELSWKEVGEIENICNDIWHMVDVIAA